VSELLKHPGESSNDSLTPEGKAAAHTRRTFLFKLALGLNAAVGAVLAVPLIEYLLGPAMNKDSQEGSWIAIGSASDFKTGETELVDFESPVRSLGDGQTAKVACWVRRTSAAPFAGLRSRSSFSAHATEAPITRTVQGPPGRPNAASSSIAISFPATRWSSTPAICPRSRRKPLAERSR
jgi:hypothetical protein